MNYMEQFNKHVKETGIKGLLPQNLSNNVLNRMMEEIESYENKNSDIPAATLLMAVASIQRGDIIKDDIDHVKITFASEGELMDKFISYKMCVILEAMRRNNSVDIPAGFLPTLKNIFDKDRKIQISELE